MSLILGYKTPGMKVGYPTRSDKYDVISYICDDEVSPGTLVYSTGDEGHVTTNTSGTRIGYVIATIISTPTTLETDFDTITYPENSVVGVLTRGYIAVSVADTSKVVAGAKTTNGYTYTGYIDEDNSLAEVYVA